MKILYEDSGSGGATRRFFLEWQKIFLDYAFPGACGPGVRQCLNGRKKSLESP